MSKKKKGKKPNNRKNRQEKKVGFFGKWLKNQQQRLPFIKFVLGMTLIMILFFTVSSTEFFENTLNLPLVMGYASIGSMLLNLFGLGTEVVEGTKIVSSAFSMNVAKGCDAVSPTVLFLAAIAVYPTQFSNKWKWLLLAPFGLALLNVVRIVTLYLLGVYAPSFFDFAHYEFWQGVFIVITIAAWFYWLLSVLNKKQTNELA